MSITDDWDRPCSSDRCSKRMGRTDAAVAGRAPAKAANASEDRRVIRVAKGFMAFSS
jgi:hypothetical protein